MIFRGNSYIEAKYRQSTVMNSQRKMLVIWRKLTVSWYNTTYEIRPAVFMFHVTHREKKSSNITEL